MTKELVTIEFRYVDAPNNEYSGEHKTKKITIGVFDTFDEAIIEGNKVLEILESRFNLNPYYSRRERFSKNGGGFGEPIRLISPLGYLKTPFNFYAKIETLNYQCVNQTIDEVLGSVERYREFKNSES